MPWPVRFPVISDPEVLGGTLVFRGTRVPAQSLFDYLKDGYTLVEFLSMFPTVERRDAETFWDLVCRQKRPIASDGSFIVGNPDRFAFRLHACEQPRSQLRRVDILIDGTALPLRDNNALTTCFAGVLTSGAEYLKSTINWHRYTEDFGERNITEMHEFLLHDEQYDRRQSYRFLDWGETTDDVVSFLIPYCDSLYLTYQMITQHADETAPHGYRTEYSIVNGIQVTPFELICTLEQTADLLMRDWELQIPTDAPE